MTPLAWLLGLVLPACGASGAQGLPPPAQMDLRHIQRPASPNTALAAPADWDPKPDIVTPVFPMPATRLYATVETMVLRQPRVFLAAEYPGRLQIHFVARSAWLNFPDLIAAQVIEAGPETSRLVLYSRSVYGYSDLGVNRQRLTSWLAELSSTINPTNER